MTLEVELAVDLNFPDLDVKYELKARSHDSIKMGEIDLVSYLYVRSVYGIINVSPATCHFVSHLLRSSSYLLSLLLC